MGTQILNNLRSFFRLPLPSMGSQNQEGKVQTIGTRALRASRSEVGSKEDLRSLMKTLDPNTEQFQRIQSALVSSGVPFFVDQTTGRKYSLMNPLERLLGGYKLGGAGVIGDDYVTVRGQVRQMKSGSGNGVSTLIIVRNATAANMVVTSRKSSSGKFYTIPQTIPPGKYMGFLHVKSDGAACGSVGSVDFQASGRELSISWDTPWLGANRVDGSPGWVDASIQENNASPTVYFNIQRP